MMQEWWQDAKLGVFLHWGIYAVKGVSESWSFFNGHISYDDYMEQINGFTAKNYDPDAWAKMFHEAGAKYVVLATKHHDGVALWDTKVNELSVVQRSPAARDLVGPYCEALRKYGIKVGLYFSLIDWSNPDYAAVWPNGGWSWEENKEYAESRHWEFHPPSQPDDPERWQKFLAANKEQMRELCSQYQPDIIWFDGDWWRGDDQWQADELRAWLHEQIPHIIINSRLRNRGDFATPEQELPVVPPPGPWELCMTVNDNWGFRHSDQNFKSHYEIIRILAECAVGGGNLLLGLGPREDGTFPAEEEATCQGLGRWTKKYAEAIYATERGIAPAHFAGGSSLSKDHKSLYLFVYDRPVEKVVFKGVKGPIVTVSDLGSGETLKYSKFGGYLPSHNSSTLWIDFPSQYHDSLISVIKVEFAEPIQLSQHQGSVISHNSGE